MDWSSRITLLWPLTSSPIFLTSGHATLKVNNLLTKLLSPLLTPDPGVLFISRHAVQSFVTRNARSTSSMWVSLGPNVWSANFNTCLSPCSEILTKINRRPTLTFTAFHITVNVLVFFLCMHNHEYIMIYDDVGSPGVSLFNIYCVVGVWEASLQPVVVCNIRRRYVWWI